MRLLLSVSLPPSSSTAKRLTRNDAHAGSSSTRKSRGATSQATRPRSRSSLFVSLLSSHLALYAPADTVCTHRACSTRRSSATPTSARPKSSPLARSSKLLCPSSSAPRSTLLLRSRPVSCALALSVSHPHGPSQCHTLEPARELSACLLLLTESASAVPPCHETEPCACILSLLLCLREAANLARKHAVSAAGTYGRPGAERATSTRGATFSSHPN